MNELRKTSVVDIHKVNGVRPEFDVYIGRSVRFTEFTKSSKWANPFFKTTPLSEYEDLIKEKIRLRFLNLDELRGKRLGCWCVTTDKIKPLVCHGQVLMKLIREEFGDE